MSVALAAASSSRVRRFVSTMAILLAALVLLIAAMLTITIGAWPTSLSSLVLVNAGNDLTIDQWLQMQQAAAASGCGLDWSILAGLEKEETDFGRNRAMFTPHDGGIVGLVQMQPGNWAIFAPPGGNPFDQHDALTAAAKFLCAHSAASDIRGALFAYDHLDSYVADVLNWAQIYSGRLGPALGTDTTGASATGSSSGLGAEVVMAAETWKGVPYLWGGASRAGIDCSGLVMRVFAQFGVQLPHNAQLQYNAVAHIRDDQLQPGDLVFFAQTYADPTQWVTHVGIYIGNGLQLNAPTDGQVVSVQPVFGGFWGAHYAGAGRVPLPVAQPPAPPAAESQSLLRLR